jgi:membrane-associated HD superfamily phosphohydrolase
MIREHKTETNEVIDREMTVKEAADYASQLEAVKIKNDEQLAKETQKAALLVRLGITAEEAALLLS